MFGGLTHEPARSSSPSGWSRSRRPASSTCSSPTRARSASRSRSRWRCSTGARGRPRSAGCSPCAAATTATRSARWRCATRSAACTTCSAACCPSTCSRRGRRAGFDDAVTRRTPSSSACVERHADELAAVIVEPVVQGAGGMRFYAPGGTCALLRELCDAHDVLLMLDEIATGFGRTGELFARRARGRRAGHHVPRQGADRRLPDAGRHAVHARASPRRSRGEGGVFMHGPTFMANPLACAVALASIDLLLAATGARTCARSRPGCAAGSRRRASSPRRARRARARRDRRGRARAPVDVARRRGAAVERGVWLRPFGKLVYTMPPYVTDDDDVAAITAAMVAAARVAAHAASRGEREPATEQLGGRVDRHRGPHGLAQRAGAARRDQGPVGSRAKTLDAHDAGHRRRISRP